MIIRQSDDNLRKYLFQCYEDVNLSHIINLYREWEIKKELLNDEVKTKPQYANAANNPDLPRNTGTKPKFRPKSTCSKCGFNHPYKCCPAFEKTCEKCFEKGHFTHCCKKEAAENSKRSWNPLNGLNGNNYEDLNVSTLNFIWGNFFKIRKITLTFLNEIN